MEKLKRNKKRARQLAEGKPLPKRKTIDFSKTFESKRNALPLEEDEPRRTERQRAKPRRVPPQRPLEGENLSAVELRIRDIRRQRSRRKWRNIIIVIALIAAVLAWVTGLYGASLSLAADIGEGIRIALSGNGEFPAKTGVSKPSQLMELNGGFLVLGSQDLAVFSGAGSKLRVIQHGYGRPVITGGSNRFCIYNRAGTEYRIESRTRNITTKTTDMPIILCEMSPGGSLAVITQSEDYNAELVVYSTEQLPIYRWYMSDKEGAPVRISFAADNKRFVLGTLKAENGILQSTLDFMDIRREDVTASYTADGSILVGLQWMNNSTLLAVFDNMAVTIDSHTGEEIDRFSYPNQILRDYSVDGGIALLFHVPTGSRLVLLDPTLNPALDTITDPASQVTYVSSHGGIAYLVRESSVTGINTTGEVTLERQFHSIPRGVLQAHRLLVFVDNQVDILQTEGGLGPEVQ